MNVVQGFMAKARQRWSFAMAVFFLLIAVVVNIINPMYGVSLTMAGVWALVGFLLMAALVGIAILLVDQAPDTAKEFIRLLMIGFTVLLVASMVTPLQRWVANLIGIPI